MTRRPTLVLDFDGVLHSYVSPWAGATVVPDPPVPGAREFLVAALEKFDVCVVSSRSHEPGGPLAMARWLRWQMGGSVVFLEDGPAWTPNLEGGDGAVPEGPYVRFPLHKPPAHVTVDDRALTFMGVWPSVESLLEFKPWNRGGNTSEDAGLVRRSRISELESALAVFARHYELNDCAEKDPEGALEIPLTDLATAVEVLARGG